MKNSKKLEAVERERERESHNLEKSGYKIKKINNKEIIIVSILILVILSIIVNLIMGLWFNNKLNLMNRNWLNEIANYQEVDVSGVTIKNTTKKFDFPPLVPELKNYNAKTEYISYSANYFEENPVPTDENGVRQVIVNQNKEYNPVAIAQYGLNQYGDWINTSQQKYYDSAKIQADYLLETQDKKNGKFYYNFDFQVGGTNQTLKAPWSSAMAQGQAISLLARIYYISKDEKYLEAAKLAMKPLTVDVEDGGLCADFFGYPYYEEYPTVPASYTLNGFMFTLVGLHDLYSITEDKQAKKLYDDGIKTLDYCLPFYDSIGISLYHLGHLTDKNLPLHTSEKYHNIHIRLLRIINKWENNATFMYYADKWEGYVKENS